MDAFDYFRRRWDRSCPEGLRDYPWWLPLYTACGELAAACGAVAQRWETVSLLVLLAAFALSVWDPVASISGRLLPWWWTVLTTTAGVSLLLAYPVSGDVAPVLLIFGAAKLTSTNGARIGLLVTALYVGVLLVALAERGLWGAAIYPFGV